MQEQVTFSLGESRTVEGGTWLEEVDTWGVPLWVCLALVPSCYFSVSPDVTRPAALLLCPDVPASCDVLSHHRPKCWGQQPWAETSEIKRQGKLILP